MRRRRPYALCLLIALLLVTSGVTRIVAQGNPAVLVVHTYGYDSPGRTAFDDAFARKLRELTGGTADLYIESLDTNRLLGEDQARARAHLRQKYAGKNIDVVVAVYGLALNFLIEGDSPFPGVPIAATLTRRPAAVPPGVVYTSSSNAIRDTAQVALQLHPRATQLAVVDAGPVRTERDELGREIAAQIDGVRGTIPMVPLRDLSLTEVLLRVQALPPGTPILVTRQMLGLKGEPIAHPEAVRRIAAAANGPVYVTTDQVVGTGAVGGVVLNFTHLGASLAALAVRVAEHGADIPPTEDQLSPTFDWRAMQRWNISESNLPPGSVVLFKQFTFWDQYRWYAIGAMIVVSVQTALITGLVIQRRRRRRAQLALRDSEQQLRGAYDQNRDLVGRLINAQEAERARIARELHDDVSQQLAGLGIMISSLKHGAGRPDAARETESTIANLQERTSTLAKTVRALSHELHPSVLQHAGLIATLRRYCADVAAQHAIRVAFTARDDFAAPDADVSLCLFRVTQEAVANAIRHGQARRVDVSLTAGMIGVELRIHDDGVGFNAGAPTKRGLGLRSIDERVRLLGGGVRMESQPRHGTTLTVSLPDRGLAT